MLGDSEQLVTVEEARKRGRGRRAAALLARSRCGRCLMRFAAPALLHLNIMLVLFAGAGLATAARLRWDASTYLPARLLLPLEARALAVLLPAASMALLALTHLALLAPHLRPTRSIILYLGYATAMALLLVAEGCVVVWLMVRIRAWLDSDGAEVLFEAIHLMDSVRSLLGHLGHRVELLDQMKDVIDEVEKDAPQNLYVVVGAGVALGVLQAVSVVLALAASCAVATGRSRRTPRASPKPKARSTLKVLYKDGRMQVVK